MTSRWIEHNGRYWTPEELVEHMADRVPHQHQRQVKFTADRINRVRKRLEDYAKLQESDSAKLKELEQANSDPRLIQIRKDLIELRQKAIDYDLPFLDQQRAYLLFLFAEGPLEAELCKKVKDEIDALK